jgi:hypothetical protein
VSRDIQINLLKDGYGSMIQVEIKPHKIGGYIQFYLTEIDLILYILGYMKSFMNYLGYDVFICGNEYPIDRKTHIPNYYNTLNALNGLIYKHCSNAKRYIRFVPVLAKSNNRGHYFGKFKNSLLI